MTRKPIGLTAPYRPKTVLAPNAPWPDPNPAPKTPKAKPLPKPPTKSAQVDKKFEQWLASGKPSKMNTKAQQKVAQKSEPA